MRSTLGTSVALAGVLLAGTAAAAVNTQALTESTNISPIGVSATVLLPPTDVVSGTEASTPTDVVSGTEASTPISSTDNSVSDQPTSVNPTGTGTVQQPALIPAPVSNITYGNPNPGTSGDDEDEDDDGDEDDD